MGGEEIFFCSMMIERLRTVFMRIIIYGILAIVLALSSSNPRVNTEKIN